MGLTLITSLLNLHTKIRKLDCQFEPHYFKHKEQLTDHTLLQTTRKRNCPATITIREFEVFPEYGYSAEELEQMTDYALRKFKSAKLENFRGALAGKQPVKIEILYHYLFHQSLLILAISVECNLVWLSVHTLRFHRK